MSNGKNSKINQYTKQVVWRRYGVKRRNRNNGTRDDDHPYIRFDIKLSLKGMDLKQCKKEILPEIEELFCKGPTKKAGVRFADVLIANMLAGYRKDENSPAGIELAQSKESPYSIQYLGMRKISEYTVGTVLKWLCDNGYAQKIRAHTKCKFTMISGDLYVTNCTHVRSSLFVATPKLMKLVSAPVLGNSKVCKTCGEDKSLSEYGKQRDGYESECKSCRADRKRKQRDLKKVA